jgi:HPt (histidine-containing phosphotransfer) domain-containing protein
MTLDDLAAYGANVDEGMARCMNNEAFYLRLVGMAKDERGFGALEEAIAANDLQAAFEAAHSLKGVLGNLALTPLLDPVKEITELLRSKTEMDYSELLATIAQERDRLAAL